MHLRNAGIPSLCGGRGQFLWLPRSADGPIFPGMEAGASAVIEKPAVTDSLDHACDRRAGDSVYSGTAS